MKRRATNKNENPPGRPPDRRTAGRPGQAVPIVIPQEHGGFLFDGKELMRILQESDALDKPVVVVAVAGAFRTGKSFLLNFFLRYLRNQGRADWIGDVNTPLAGFSWRGGCERHTTGILLWDEVFLVTRPTGDQVAVLLMDTQGTFDSETTFKEVTTIFALSALTSSVQVYNLSQNIKEDDLQHLQYFISYGQMAQNQQSSEKPFQKLVFLVRDWGFVTSYPYGAEGGKALVKERLKTSNRREEQRLIRDLMKSCFQQIDCFLMPYPGTQVATGQSAEGYLQHMNHTFKNHLKEFVASLLAGDKLLTKRIQGEQITCREWVIYFSKYAEIFEGGHLPEPKSIFEMTAAANNQAALNQAKAGYFQGMDKECGANKPFKNKWDMTQLHEAQLKAALDLFTRRPKMGGNLVAEQYLKILKKELEEMRENFFELNMNKSCNGTAVALSVPIVMSLGGAAAAVALSGPIGVAAIVTSFLIGGTSTGTLTAWSVSRATGKIRTFREALDSTVDYAWRRVWRGKKTSTEAASPIHCDSPGNDNDEMAEFVETARPVQILRTCEDHSFELDEAALRRILLANDVKDKPVVVVSVAGAVQTGKSFLLDFFLRYMRTGGQGDWICDPRVPLGGFSWGQACESGTSGIVFWEEVFLVTRSDGQQVAVLFMYTHGAFEAGSTIKDCKKLLALSTMTSSVQVYNLLKTIREDDLKHLQFLKEFERMVQQERSEMPFQELLFLVRDWSDRKDATYGSEGGRDFLERWLQVSKHQNKEVKQLQTIMLSCFTEIRCFLMPHPGPKVATTPSFYGPISDVDDNFKEQLQQLVSSILEPDKLLVKKINGKEISCAELVTHFQVYVDTFKEHKQEESEFKPQVFVDTFKEYKHEESEFKPQVTEDLNILIAMATAKYTSFMEELCNRDELYLSPAVLQRHHREQWESARQWFSKQLKKPEEEVSQRCLDTLKQAIDETFEKFAMHNTTKMTLAEVRTSATHFAALLAFYFLSRAFTLLGLYSLANFFNVLMVLPFTCLGLWSYGRLSGCMTEAVAFIDNIAFTIWANVCRLWDLCKTAMEDRIERARNIRPPGGGRRAHRKGPSMDN